MESKIFRWIIKLDCMSLICLRSKLCYLAEIFTTEKLVKVAGPEVPLADYLLG